MNQKLKIWLLLLLFDLALSSCNKTDELPEKAISPTATPTAPPLIFEIPDTELPLAEPGPYAYKMVRGIRYQDPQRDDREISIDIFYPSVDDEPDLRGAPFPLIINDHKMLDKFGTHLVSHGFVVVGINGIDTYSPWDENLYNQPLDYIFALNQLSDNPPDSLIEIIDTDHVGVWGYSFGGNNSMFLSGARLDPDYYFSICENPEDTNFLRSASEFNRLCGPYNNWDKFVMNAGSAITDSNNGLWQTITDDRILAVMPMSASNELLFGPEGLAAANKAVLITAGTTESSQYYDSSFKAYQEYDSSEKEFISFIKQSHNMIFGSDAPQKMQHLAIAFFSYHLKDNDEYAYYFSEEYIS
jgi:predicted dienelactone hydrolase